VGSTREVGIQHFRRWDVPLPRLPAAAPAGRLAIKRPGRDESKHANQQRRSQPKQAMPGDPVRRTHGRPSLSDKFEEINADTLLGSHSREDLVPYAGSNAGSWDAPRDARAGTWDRTREVGIAVPTVAQTDPRASQPTREVGITSPVPGAGVGGPIFACDRTREVGIARGKLGSARGKLGSECRDGGIDQ
jgi:hypothetical protein